MSGECVSRRPCVVPLEFLGRQPAHALHEAAFDLAAVDAFVNRVAHVVQDVRAQHPRHAGEAVHFHFAHRRAAGEVVERLAPAGRAVPVNARRGIVAGRRQADALHVGLPHDLREAHRGPWPPAVADKAVREDQLAGRRRAPKLSP